MKISLFYVYPASSIQHPTRRWAGFSDQYTRLFLLGYLIVTASLLTGCSPQTSSQEAPDYDDAEFIGDEACASCHEEIYVSFHQTGMGRSVSQFDAATAPETFDPPARIYNPRFDYYYEPFLRGDTLYQREYRLDEQGEVIHERIHAAEWVIGSGNATRSYLMNVNGHVTQMPLTWYVNRAKWDLSPAYQQQNFRFERAIGLECMGCHNGTPAYSPYTQGHYTDLPLGITCERCHGAGGRHADLQMAGMGPPAGEADASIVNPARLERPLQLSICQQCHLTGITVFGPGEDMTTFKPGASLADHRTVFAMEEQLTDPDRFGIASHALRLARSACFQKGEMTCITCHDPHRPVATLDDSHFNDACESCHRSDASAAPAFCSRPDVSSVEEAMSGNCIGCHLQEGGTTDIPHVTFTDHWIRRTIPPSVAPEDVERELVRTTPFTLVPVEQEIDDNDPQFRIEEAIAYFRFYETHHELPAYLPKIVTDSREALHRGAEHEEGRLVLARALIEMDSLAAAKTVLEEALIRYPGNARLQYWLGTVRLEMGDSQGASSALRKALDISPRFSEARLKYAESLDASGHPDLAETEYLTLLDDDPVHLPEAWNNLGFLYLQTNRLEEALPRFLQAAALDPDMATAWANAGSVVLVQEDFESAAGYFERALDVDASFVPALGNLGLTYWRLGRLEEARRMLTRLVAIQPDDARAWELLRQLEEEM